MKTIQDSDPRVEVAKQLVHYGTEDTLQYLWFEIINGTCGLRAFKECIRMTLDTYIAERAAEEKPGILTPGTALGFRVYNPASKLFMKTGPWGRSWSKTGRTWTTIAHLKSSMTGKFGRPDVVVNKYYLREIDELKKLHVFSISENKLVECAYDLWARPPKK